MTMLPEHQKPEQTWGSASAMAGELGDLWNSPAPQAASSLDPFGLAHDTVAWNELFREAGIEGGGSAAFGAKPASKPAMQSSADTYTLY